MYRVLCKVYTTQLTGDKPVLLLFALILASSWHWISLYCSALDFSVLQWGISLNFHVLYCTVSWQKEGSSWKYQLELERSPKFESKYKHYLSFKSDLGLEKAILNWCELVLIKTNNSKGCTVSVFSFVYFSVVQHYSTILIVKYEKKTFLYWCHCT